jgi:hypothetical protein
MMAVPAKGRKGVAKRSCRERLHLFFLLHIEASWISRDIFVARCALEWLQGEQEEMAGNNDGR